VEAFGHPSFLAGSRASAVPKVEKPYFGVQKCAKWGIRRNKLAASVTNVPENRTGDVEAQIDLSTRNLLKDTNNLVLMAGDI